MSSLVDELWPALLPGAAAAALGVASVTAAVLCAFPPRIKVSLSSAGGSVAARSAGAGSANAHMAGVGADTAEAAPAASKLSRPSITMIARLGVALGLLALVPGPAGLVAAIGGYVFSGRLLAKLEPGEVRRRREQLEALAPLAVELIGVALASGSAIEVAVRRTAQVIPMPMSDELDAAVARLMVGTDPELVWADLSRHPQLGPLGRALLRCSRSGAALVPALQHQAFEQRSARRAQLEAKARAVDARTSLPLGLCLLPSFLLIGVVPLVASGFLGTFLGS